MAAEIAANEGIPRRFLDSILRQLTHAGLLKSSRGPRGGYSLGMPASEINVASVIRILDREAFSFPCLKWDQPERCAECPGAGACAAHTALRSLRGRSLRLLGDTTLADLVERLSPTRAAPSALLTLRRASAV